MKLLSRTAIYERAGNRLLTIHHNRAIVSLRMFRSYARTDMPHLGHIVWSPDENAEAADVDGGSSIYVSVTTSRNVQSPVELAL